MASENIYIHSLDGKVLLSVLITEEALFHEELMTSDYVMLSWNSDSGMALPLGSYIIYNGEKYSLLEEYNPERTDEYEYRFSPQFHSRIMGWQKQPVPLYTYGEDGITVTGREFDWEFTGSPTDAMYMVQQAIKNETGETWSVQLADSLPATISVSSQSDSIFSLLSQIADACKTEWWVDKSTNTLFLSFCQHGSPVSLSVGVNIKAPSVTSGNKEYFTRFYAFGSTRNITQDNEGGQATNHIVNKRLTLDPAKYPGGYKDVKGHFDNGVFVSDLKPGEIFSTTVYLDDIYPKSKLTISDVRARLKYRLDSGTGDKVQVGTDDDGSPIYEQYAIWYFKIANFSFDLNSIIEGENLSVSFETGQLAGRDFELSYHEKAETVKDGADVTDFEVEAGDYEIILDETSGITIPGLAYIIPQDGDQIVLYNIKMPNEYVASAREELETAIDKEISTRTSDNNSYEFDSDPVSFNDDSMDVMVGQSVNFSNIGTLLQTRVLMVEKHLDYPCQQRIRVGNERIKGNTQQLKEDVTNASQNIDLLKAFNNLSQSLTNAYANAQREMIEGFASIKNMWRFDPDDPSTIYSEFNAYVKGAFSALGKSTETGGGGSFDLLQDWAQYDAGTAKSTALSAYLGYELYQKLQSGAVLSLKSEGTGNVVTGISKNGTVLTVTKGSIDLSPYATKGELDDRIDELVNGAPAAFDTLKEIADVLQGNVDSIGDIITTLGTKADKAVKITAGAGLTGGGDLSANRTLALAAVGTAGTYTKVTTDAYGRVTAGTTLSAADIPTLAISKISGLQTALDSKLNAADFAQYFAEQMAQWFVRDTGNKALRPADYGGEAYGLYSNAFVSALGVSQGGASGGGSVDILQDWAEYTGDKATWALSAYLGYGLYQDVQSLKGGAALTVETTGGGNVVTGISKSGTKLTVAKGITALTSVSLATITDLNSSWDALLKAAPAVFVTRWPSISEVRDKQNLVLMLNGGTTEGTSQFTYNGTSAKSVNITTANIGAPTKTGSGASGTWGISISGNAATASKWQTARTLTLTGAVTGSASIDGSGNVSLATTYSTGNISALDSRYVNVSGDTMTGTLTLPASGMFTNSPFRFGNDKGRMGADSSGNLGIYGAGYVAIRPSSATAASSYGLKITSSSLEYNGGKVWHAGNDGSGSGLDADTLDGRHYTSFPLRIGGGLYTTTDNPSVKLLTFTRGGDKGWLRISISDSNNGGSGITALYVVKWPYNSSSDASTYPVSISCLYSTVVNVSDRLTVVRTSGATFDLYYTPNSNGSEVGCVLEGYGGTCTINNYNNHIAPTPTPTYTSSQGLLFTNISGSLSGNASTATKLQTARQINGTNFDGTANITTAKWGTARSIYIRDASQAHTGAAVSVDGSANEYLLLPSTIAAALEGNATSATKLQTARTLWGRSFNGTANVSGDMSSVGNISLSGRLYWKDGIYGDQFAIDTDFVSTYDHNKLRILSAVGDANTSPSMTVKLVILGSSGNVGIGTETPSYKLHVSGTGCFTGLLTANGGILVPSSKTLKIGSGTISWDTANNMFHFSHGLYSDGAVSALGVGSASGGGGGGSVDILQDWAQYDAGTAKSTALSAYLGYEMQQDLQATIGNIGNTPDYVCTLDLSDIDLDFARIQQAVLGKRPMFYIVTDNSVGNYVVGTMCMFSDNMHHVLTQVLTTHFFVQDGVFSAHIDSKVYTYYRSYNFGAPGLEGPTRQWTEWREAYGLTGEGSFMGVATPSTAAPSLAYKEEAYYVAATAGTYANLGGLTVASGEVALIRAAYSPGDPLTSFSKTTLSKAGGAVTIASITDLHSSWDSVLKAQKPSWLTSVSIATISDLNSGWDALLKAAPSSHITRWPTFSEVSSKPTTLSGYGITDAVGASDAVPEGMTITRAASSFGLTLKTIVGGDLDELSLPMATTSLAGLMSASDKSKLNSALTSVSLSTISDLNSSWDALLKAAPAAATASTMGFMSASDKAKMTEFSNALYNLETMGLLKNDGNGYLERLSSVTQSTNSITINFVAQHLTSAGVPQSGYSIVTLPAASTTKAGLMSATDFVLLQGLSHAASSGGGNGILHAPLTTSRTSTSVSINYTVSQYDGSAFKEVDFNLPIPAATTSAAGVMAAADKAKLDGYSVATMAEVEALF